MQLYILNLIYVQAILILPVFFNIKNTHITTLYLYSTLNPSMFENILLYIRLFLQSLKI